MGWTAQQVMNASDEWRWVPEQAERLHVGPVEVIDYPEWARMGFYATPLEVEDPADAVACVHAEAARRGRAKVDWWISPSTTAGVGERVLEAGGEITDELDVLAFDMTDGLPGFRPEPRVSAQQVLDVVGLDAYERLGWTPTSECRPRCGEASCRPGIDGAISCVNSVRCRR